MPYPHVIRLRGPWELAVVERDAPAAAAAAPDMRVTVPSDWSESLGASFRGIARYRRRFNRPTNLEPAERVWLVVEGIDGHGTCALNGQPLGTTAGYALGVEFDITPHVAASNVLEIAVALRDGTETPPRPGRASRAGGLIGEVRLEIRAAAHVARLALCWEPDLPTRLCVRGRVAATAPGQDLALVVTGCQRELIYAPVSADEDFAFTTPVDGWPPWPDPHDEPVLTRVEVRLLAGATCVWQTTRETAPPATATPPGGKSSLAEWAAAAARHNNLPWYEYATPSEPAWSALLRDPAPCAGLRGVLEDAAYVALDRANKAVVQFLPRAWAAEVCPRLAHHPSIVAWVVLDEECPARDAAAHDSLLADCALGRPWIRLPPRS